jgi:hypothetical protein
MGGNSEEYRGYTIHLDIAEVPHMGFWNGTVEIVFPVDGSSTTSVHSIAGIPDRFLTEDEARDYLCRAAKDWIDARLEETTRSPSTSKLF